MCTYDICLEVSINQRTTEGYYPSSRVDYEESPVCG